MDKFLENDYLKHRKEEMKFVLIDFAKLLSSCLFVWFLGYIGGSMSWVILIVLIIVTSGYLRKKMKKKRISGRNVSLNEKEVILATMKDLPSWVFFPDVEKAEWLNKIISQMWPFIGSYVKNFIIYDLQPLFEESLPAIAKPFRFAKLDLGDMSPRIGGIKTYTGEKIRRDEIVMDVEFYLYSDAGIKVEVRGIHSGVKDFQIRGTLRVLCRPLIPRFPLIGAITVCFINNPYINFDLTNMGSLLELPGIGEIFRGVLEDIIASILVLPNRFSIPLVQEIELSQLRHPLPQGVLRIHAMAARDLIGADIRLFAKNTSDPYCILKVGAQKFQTSVIKNNLNPIWDEYFEAIVDQRVGQCLELLVYDKDVGHKGDFLGRASVEIEDVYRSGSFDDWLDLIGVKRGSVHLNLTWYELQQDPGQFEKCILENKSITSFKNHKLSSGFLYVVVDSAKNLKPVTKSEEPSPFGILRLGNQIKKLKILKDSTNPVWEKVCHFFIANPQVEQLQLTLFDRTEDHVLGKCQINIQKLLKEPNMMMERAFPLTDSTNPDGLIYLRLALRALKKGDPIPLLAGGPTGLEGITEEHDDDASLHEAVIDEFVPGVLDPSVPFMPRSHLQRRNDQFRESVSETSERPKPGGSAGTTQISPQRSQQMSPTSENRSPLLNSSPELSPTMSPRNALATSFVPVEQLDGGSSINFSSDYIPQLGLLRLTISFNKQKHALIVNVIQAKNLMPLDTDGVSDPFVELEVSPKHLFTDGKRKKTRIVKNTLNPQFDEVHQFSVEQRHLSQCVLLARVRNHVGILQRGQKPMGIVRLQLHACLANVSEVTEWYEIRPPTSANNDRSSASNLTRKESHRRGFLGFRRKNDPDMKEEPPSPSEGSIS